MLIARALYGLDLNNSHKSALEAQIGTSLLRLNVFLSANRILDTESGRREAIWGANLQMRLSRLSVFAARSSREVSWAEVAFRLWSRYHAVMWTTLRHSGGKLRASRRGTGIPLTFINARRVQGFEASNPEGPMWTSEAFDGLTSGRKMFLDAERLSESELIELLSCLLHTTSDDQLFIDYQDSGCSDWSGAPQHAPFLTNSCRYYFPNEINEVFIHYGSREVPDRSTQQHIRNNVFQEPTATTIASVITHLATQHNASKDLEFGLEAVLYRSTFYASHKALGVRKNIGAYKYIAADGSWELHLPRLNTAAAYFDTLRVPSSVSEHLRSSLALGNEEFLHSDALLCHARAVSINWAAYATSMLGGQWAACLPEATPNYFVRHHVDTWIRRYYTGPVNRWSEVHANAMASQYGFCPMKETRTTEAQTVLDWWTEIQAPYLANPYHDLWLMVQIPSHQLLPFHDPDNPCSAVVEHGRSRLLYDTQSFQALFKCDMPFPSRHWLASGEMTRNAQFFVAQGDGVKYRYNNGRSATQLTRWFRPHQTQPPEKSTTLPITWMGPAGTPFSDFVLPGSMPALDMATNRVYSWGVVHERDGRSDLHLRWYLISLETPNESLMVNYLHPLKV